ncbi:glucan biosynthesis protein [Alteromonas antoniana]|uniref:glucan biosynthesis protein n=1 Tax=Alteromonas antoniana TaxID=2803813 RepID=UPI001FEC6BD8|nr:glucan biosynthesis protein G [Alteromonas antoniana]
MAGRQKPVQNRNAATQLVRGVPRTLRASMQSLAVCATLSMMLLTANSAAQDIDSDKMPGEAAPILQSVIDDAMQSAQDDYTADDHDLHQKLKSMDYQAYRAIRFDAQSSLWRDKNDYEIQFFHPGFLYEKPVSIVTVDRKNQTQPLSFNSDMFRYEDSATKLKGLTTEKSGFAGFRVHYPIKNDQYKDEFAVFLGASYFRLVGKNQVYGISARGLAIDTALPKGEEFPHFTKFWLIEPVAGEPITVYARLESPSVAGAYKFEITPGTDTTVATQAWLFAREDVEKLGIAPFTSMFLYGENTEKAHDDYRPEVHDSDGVMMKTHNDEVIWRPLTNPKTLQITSLSDTHPKGFGMLQRDTRWENYLDAEANYHLRPGLWVTPEHGFAKGRLELVEIPTPSETHDNIVAYWVPEKPLLEGESAYFAYTLATVEGSKTAAELANVVHTRQGASVLPGEEVTEETRTRRFVVDFSVPEDKQIDPQGLSLSLSAAQGKTVQPRTYLVNGGKNIRVTFLLEPDSSSAVDMRMYINYQDQRISEVWNYVYQPK